MLPAKSLLPSNLAAIAPPLHQIRGLRSNVSFDRLFTTTSKGTLKLDSIAPILTLQRSRKRSPQLPKIRTLSPQKLVQDDYLDFSLKTQPLVGVIFPSSQSTDAPISGALQSNRTPLLKSLNVLPPGTHGFLYYHVPHNSSPLSGELRFRITPSRDPASFATGSDWLTDRAMPWRYPLYKMACRPSFQNLVALLLQDGLVSQRTLDLVTAAVASVQRTSTNAQHGAEGLTLSESVSLSESESDARQPARLLSTPVLSTFGQEFLFRYSADLNFCGVFASPDTIFMHHMRHITAFHVLRNGKYVAYFPFKGSAVCCFERSKLPKHAGRRMVVIRVKRFIDSDPIRPVPPPSQGNARAHLVQQLRPREGELLNVVTYDRVEPWAVDVDKVWKVKAPHLEITPWRALRVFFENEELYGSPGES